VVGVSTFLRKVAAAIATVLESGDISAGVTQW
jgi:hypothetical protein